MGKKADYQIIILKNNERLYTVSNHYTQESAIRKYNKMLEENKEIVFPIKFLNVEKIESVKYHIAIIKRKTDTDDDIPKLRNDYGEYVDHVVVDNDEWIMFEKEEYKFEESFWVYGYNPHYYRKTFMWIYEELVKKHANNKRDILSIGYYKNKVLFETINHIDMVICKNKDDGIRLFSLLDDYVQNDKLKYIMFIGNLAATRNQASKVRDKIQSFTHWTRNYINYPTT